MTASGKLKIHIAKITKICDIASLHMMDRILRDIKPTDWCMGNFTHFIPGRQIG